MFLNTCKVFKLAFSCVGVVRNKKSRPPRLASCKRVAAADFGSAARINEQPPSLQSCFGKGKVVVSDAKPNGAVMYHADIVSLLKRKQDTTALRS